MSQDLMRVIIISATLGIIAGIGLTALTKWQRIKSRKPILQWIISVISTMASIVGIITFVIDVWPGPKILKLEGIVLDGLIKMPVESAEVTVIDFSSLTDNNGHYSIKYDGHAKPEWKIRAAKTGYRSAEITAPVGQPIEIIIDPENP